MGSQPLELVIALATSAGLGLLVGLERSRRPLAKAGVRTFAVIAVLGTVSMLLAMRGDLEWMPPLALLLVGLVLGAASVVDPATRSDSSGTTTVVSALLVFCLGVLIALGERQLAVGVGIALTALLHFKEELEGFSQRLSATDLRSMLQFGALAAIVLPLLPHKPVDAFGAVSPFNVGLMAVLICAMSLLGYVAWRLSEGHKQHLPFEPIQVLVRGVLGGVVSSTATTLAVARHTRAVQRVQGALSADRASSVVVILLANATMLSRVLVLVLVVVPSQFLSVAPAVVAALVVALLGVAMRWRSMGSGGEAPALSYKNPAQLIVALGFALIYAIVLWVAAWVQQQLGSGGVYTVALISGATDVDAITLSSLRLLVTETLSASVASVAIACAVGANLAFKAIVCAVAGSVALGRDVAVAFALQVVVMAVVLAI